MTKKVWYFYDRVPQVEIRGAAVQGDRLQATLGYALPGERFWWGKVAIVVIVVIQVMVVMVAVCGGSGAIMATLMCAPGAAAARTSCCWRSAARCLSSPHQVPLATSPS